MWSSILAPFVCQVRARGRNKGKARSLTGSQQIFHLSTSKLCHTASILPTSQSLVLFLHWSPWLFIWSRVTYEGAVAKLLRSSIFFLFVKIKTVYLKNLTLTLEYNTTELWERRECKELLKMKRRNIWTHPECISLMFPWSVVGILVVWEVSGAGMTDTARKDSRHRGRGWEMNQTPPLVIYCLNMNQTPPLRICCLNMTWVYHRVFFSVQKHFTTLSGVKKPQNILLTWHKI